MKQVKIMIILLAVALLAIGCGIDKEKYNQSQKELANKDTALQMKQQEVQDLKGQLAECQMENKDVSSLMNQLDQDYDQAKRKLEKLAVARQARERALQELLEKFANLIDSGKVSIEVREGRMLINMQSKVLFGFNKWNLSKEGKKTLKQVADVLKELDQRLFQVAGHTDNVRGPGKDNPNWNVSYKRARAVFDVLTDASVPESILSLAAYAEFSPVASNDTEEFRDQNRRIEIILMPTSEELPIAQLRKIEEITNDNNE